jgi:hypothetical protein
VTERLSGVAAILLQCVLGKCNEFRAYHGLLVALRCRSTRMESLVIEETTNAPPDTCDLIGY